MNCKNSFFSQSLWDPNISTFCVYGRLPCWLSYKKNPSSMEDPQRLGFDPWPLGLEDPLVEGMATHSSIFAWEILWTRETGRLQSMGLPRVGHEWSDLVCTHMSISLGKLPNLFCPLSPPNGNYGILWYLSLSFWKASLNRSILLKIYVFKFLALHGHYSKVCGVFKTSQGLLLLFSH